MDNSESDADFGDHLQHHAWRQPDCELALHTNTAGNGDSTPTPTPPDAYRQRGLPLWNANERWQCHWSGEKSASNGNNVGITGLGAGSSNPTKGTHGVVVSGAVPDFIVRVAACIRPF